MHFSCAWVPYDAHSFHSEGRKERKAAATAGLLFGCSYAVLILLVYFAQVTAAKNDLLNEQAAMLLDFSRGGLIFSYDLLGYGMMALSTFFTGLGICPKNRKDKWLKSLMLIHGIFFFSHRNVRQGRQARRDHCAGKLVRIFSADRHFIRTPF